MTNNSEEERKPVSFNIEKETVLDIFRHAASQRRTVIEFRTEEQPDGSFALNSAMDITEHVEVLEDELDTDEVEL